MTPAPLRATGDFFDLVRDGAPVALAKAVQSFTAPALELLRVRALLCALAEPDEMEEGVHARLLEEIAFRFFVDGRRRLDRPAAARFFASIGAADALAAVFPGPCGGPEEIARHEQAYAEGLRRLFGEAGPVGPAARRAAARLGCDRALPVAPFAASFAEPLGASFLPGVVVRPALDLRVASDRARDVVFRGERELARPRLRGAAARAQKLASDVTGDPRFFRLTLASEPPPFPIDGPSVGLAAFAATTLALTHRNPPPPWIGFSGAFHESGRLAPVGRARAKLMTAVAGGLRALFLPASARAELGPGPHGIELVFLPEVGPQELFECIEREVARLAPGFLDLRDADARSIFSRGEELFASGKKEAEAEFGFLVRALEGKDGTNALASLRPTALARLGRCLSRRGDAWAARRAFADAEAGLLRLKEERRLDREGRETLVELGVYKAINAIDYRDFEAARRAVAASFDLKNADPYTTNHSLAKSFGTQALVAYCEARTLPPGPERERLFDEAERALDEDMRLVQSFERGRVRGYQATLALYRGRSDEAAAIFREILAREPRGGGGPPSVNPRWAREGLAHALTVLGRERGRPEHLEEAVRVASDAVDVAIDEEIAGRLLRWKGVALRELGRLDEARIALERAAADLGRFPAGHPKNALAVGALLDLALAEAAAGRRDAAGAAAERVEALCASFEAETVRRHFAPTLAAIAQWRASGLGDRAIIDAALRRLLP
jgi:tetratricopeptide (TPR) repeat protein